MEKPFITTGNNTNDTYTITIPITVAKANTYETAFALTKQSGGTSKVTIYVDGVAIGNNQQTNGTLVHEWDQYFHLYRYEGTAIPLAAGDHYITVVASKNGKEGESNLVKFGADFVSLIPKAPEAISASGTTLEWENFSDKYVVENETANGGKLLATDWGSDERLKINVPVAFQEDGYYDIEYAVGSHPKSVDISNVSLLLDDAVIGLNNDGSDNEVLYNVLTYFNVTKYTNRMYVTAGEHTLTLDVASTGNEVVKFAADYVKFTKVTEDTVQVGANKARVIGNYSAPVTGMAVAALYNGEELVALETKNVQDVYTVTVDVATAATFDSAKLFVWSDFVTVTPIVPAKIMSDVTTMSTNVHLFGDSICVSYPAASYPQQGWGYYLPGLLADNANVINHAIGGRTAEVTYYEIWPGVKDSIKEGDYVFIAFGLNDFYRDPQYDTALSGVEVYKKYLGLLRDEAEEKGATVIFTTITPNNPKTGVFESQNTLTTWSGYIKEVAAAKGNYCLDLNAVLRKHYFYDEALGKETEEKAKEAYDLYFLSPAAMEKFSQFGTISDGMMNTANTYADWTHVNEDGAKLIAETIIAELEKTDCPLKAYVQ